MLRNYIATFIEGSEYAPYFIRIAAVSQRAAIDALSDVGFAPRYFWVIPEHLAETEILSRELKEFPQDAPLSH